MIIKNIFLILEQSLKTKPRGLANRPIMKVEERS